MDEDKNLNNPLLEGEDAETPSDSPSGTITPDSGDPVNPSGAENLSPEEAEWNSLSGSAQDRFKQVLRDKKALEQRINQGTSYTQQPTNQNQEQKPEIADAVRKLSGFGIATKDDVENTVNQKIGGLIYNFEIEKLENKYDGSNGLPKFDRDEYEDYVSRNSQYRNYAPEDVYEKMYSEELLDFKVKNLGNRGTNKASSPSLRPTRTQVREEALTPELIEQKLSEPGGREWYTRNVEKINATLARQAAQE